MKNLVNLKKIEKILYNTSRFLLQVTLVIFVIYLGTVLTDKNFHYVPFFERDTFTILGNRFLFVLMMIVCSIVFFLIFFAIYINRNVELMEEIKDLI